MKPALLPMMCVFCLGVPGFAAPAPGASPCIVALGDSITRGARPAKGQIPAVLAEETFCSLLQSELAEQDSGVRVHNAGIPSNRTDQGLSRLASDVLSFKPGLVLIMYGTNDSCYDMGKTGPRLPLNEYEKNLHAMISLIRQAGGEPILMTPPPLREGWGTARNAIYGKAGSNGPLLAYVEACRRISEQMRVPLVDHFAIWSARGNDFVSSLLPDGCHPNASGHRFLAETLLPVVRSHLSPNVPTR